MTIVPAITILGCGSSGGVPLIGCSCATCTSADAKNRRSRASVLFSLGETHLLVDSSPDLRQQALSLGLQRIDAILYTHAHADHLHGIDDLRSFNYHADRILPAYGTATTEKEVRERFDYVFQPHRPEYGWFRPALTWRTVPDEPVVTMMVEGIEVTFFRQWHGKYLTTLGIRIGDMAYSTDTNRLEESALEALQGVDTWVVDCLGPRELPTHAHLDLTLRWIERVKPRLAVLTHMGHELEYGQLCRDLPAHIIPAHDGLRLEQGKSPENERQAVLFTETLGLQI